MPPLGMLALGCGNWTPLQTRLTITAPSCGGSFVNTSPAGRPGRFDRCRTVIRLAPLESREPSAMSAAAITAELLGRDITLGWRRNGTAASRQGSGISASRSRHGNSTIGAGSTIASRRMAANASLRIVHGPLLQSRSSECVTCWRPASASRRRQRLSGSGFQGFSE